MWKEHEFIKLLGIHQYAWFFFSFCSAQTGTHSLTLDRCSPAELHSQPTSPHLSTSNQRPTTFQEDEFFPIPSPDWLLQCFHAVKGSHSSCMSTPSLSGISFKEQPCLEISIDTNGQWVALTCVMFRSAPSQEALWQCVTDATQPPSHRRYSTPSCWNIETLSASIPICLRTAMTSPQTPASWTSLRTKWQEWPCLSWKTLRRQNVKRITRNMISKGRPLCNSSKK